MDDRRGRPVESVADEIVVQVSDQALVVVGERHESVLTGLLVPRLVERRRVECLLFEAPQELVRGLDRVAPILRGDPSVQSFVSDIAVARRVGARTYGVDRPPPLLRELSFDDSLVDRNLYMAAAIHRLFASGECRSAVLVSGAGHVYGTGERRPSLVDALRTLGHEPAVVVVFDDTLLTTRRVEGVRYGRTVGDELPCVEVTAARHWADGVESEARRSEADQYRSRAALECR